ncbi:MAG: homoserine dehydrogenase [Proteobacteria bacterium]|nr:homoserine dehydrogenase [Pseudomonadota bacterium]
MNAVTHGVAANPQAHAQLPARLVLLGTGTVGGAVLQRLDRWAGTSLGHGLSLVYVANSRTAYTPASGGRRLREAPDAAKTEPGQGVLRSFQPAPFAGATGLDQVTAALGQHGTRIIIDATPSEAVAERHAGWLAQGIHVVTACKLAQGTGLARWHAIRAGCTRGHTEYGDAATVGAGLPLLRSIRDLRAGGDRIRAVAGVLSGSLAWLFNHYDGLRPFSGFVREACKAGYTEPDPREDLSGEDVRRKLLILARAAAVELEADEVEVESLVPPALAALRPEQVDAALPMLDPALRERFAAAYKSGAKLRFIARLECEGSGRVRARIGLEPLAADHPLAGGAGTDNRVAIWSDRYSSQPLLIQGPGAGAEVTAAGLLDDVLRIARTGSRLA